MPKEIAIIAHTFLDPRKPEDLNLGGSETWITEFANLLSGAGFSPVIYQPAEHDFRLKFGPAEVVGCGGLVRAETDRLAHLEIERRGIPHIVYASSFIGEKHCRPGNIFIQHGIHWDYVGLSRNPFFRFRYRMAMRNFMKRDLAMCLKSRLTICVDTNFINCARAEAGAALDRCLIRYIPNFAVPQPEPLWRGKWRAPEEINLLFARRFEPRRGVGVFAEALRRVLPQAPKMRVVLAGGGSMENFLAETFRGERRVSIIKVPHAGMPDLLNRTHIAVVPSVFSEGTSFSCLEAMSSGCAVVSSEVGGLGNLVVPDYNGLMVRPLANELERAVLALYRDTARAEALALRGYDMALRAFNVSLWRSRVLEALREAGISC